MDSLKRKRTQFRREFTIAADALDGALQRGEDPAGHAATFFDCADTLFGCEAALRDLWCDDPNFEEDEYQKDQDTALKYKIRYSQLKNKLSSNNDNASSTSTSPTMKSRKQSYRVKLPLLEISKFNSEVKRWLSFWGQFKKIDEDPEINDTDKFQYLLQSMEQNSSARQLVESYPPCGENYSKALDALKSRFAREDALIETYVRGLIALMNQKDHDKMELSTLYDSLQMHLQAFETLGVT